MGEFRFKRFSVLNEKSAMRVNTDGVLLGALMTISPEDMTVLDIGTGTGTVALMAAQRHSDMRGGDMPEIIAIDIDAPSAEEASANFSRSDWAGSLSAENVSLEAYGQALDAGTERPVLFDHIFSNPPYYGGELRSPDARRSAARHSESLSYMDIVDFSSGRLSPSGRLSLILPADVELHLSRYARMCGLFPFRIVRIRTVPGKPVKRIMAEFCRERPDEVIYTDLSIQEKGQYTAQYIDLTSPFYL